MAEIKIQKVKLIKGGEKLEIAYKETGDMNSSVDKTCDNPVHQDLKNAVTALACHLGIMTDYITEKQALNEEELQKFVVSGYSIGGKEEEEGVVITGYRKTKSGHTVTLNTPFLKLDSKKDTYYLIDNLNETIGKIQGEVNKYLFEGKRAPEQQQQLEFPHGEEKKDKVTKAQILPDETQQQEAAEVGAFTADAVSEEKKQRGRKKVPQSPIHPSGEVVA